MTDPDRETCGACGSKRHSALPGGACAACTMPDNEVGEDGN